MNSSDTEVRRSEITRDMLLALKYVSSPLATIEKIREQRFVKGHYCPVCYKEKGVVVNNRISYGYITGTNHRKYKCKTCGHFYSDLTGTLYYRSRNVDKWEKFLDLTLENKSLREIAAEIGIHYNTALSWRRKAHELAKQMYQSNRNKPSSQKKPAQDVYIQLKHSRKGQKPTTERSVTQPPETIEVKISVIKETPAHIQTELKHLNSPSEMTSCDSNSEPGSEAVDAKKVFCSYYSKMRGVSTRHLAHYLIWYKLSVLLQTLKPEISLHQLTLMGIDKDRLSHSDRLIKKMIM